MIRIRWAITAWLVILIVIALRISFATRSNSVFPIFRSAGAHWLAGESVYVPPTDRLDVFRYSPPVAAFFAPWSLMSDRAAEIGWRLLNAGVFFAALVVWIRYWLPANRVASALLLVLPLTIGGLNNGQCNALVAGLLLFAQVAFARDRWTVAASLIAVATLIKGYPLALGLVFCVIEPRRFAPRLAVCLVVGAFVPYLCQRSDYVTSQYAVYLQRLIADDRTHFDLDAGYHDLHMLVRRVNLPLTLAGYRILELVLAIAIAAIIAVQRFQGVERRVLIRHCLFLSICWMTLSGPATESSTYVILSPILAYAVLTMAEQPRWQRTMIATSFGLFLIAAMIVWFPGWISRPVHATGIQPFAALLLSLTVVGEVLSRTSRCPARRPQILARGTFAKASSSQFVSTCSR